MPKSSMAMPMPSCFNRPSTDAASAGSRISALSVSSRHSRRGARPLSRRIRSTVSTNSGWTIWCTDRFTDTEKGVVVAIDRAHSATCSQAVRRTNSPI